MQEPTPHFGPYIPYLQRIAPVLSLIPTLTFHTEGSGLPILACRGEGREVRGPLQAELDKEQACRGGEGLRDRRMLSWARGRPAGERLRGPPYVWCTGLIEGLQGLMGQPHAVLARGQACGLEDLKRPDYNGTHSWHAGRGRAEDLRF